MTAKKPLVLDANILIRACLGKKVPGLIEDLSKSVAFFTPDICVSEAQTYIPNLFKKRGIEMPSHRKLDEILLAVNIIQDQDYLSFESSAKKRIAERDINDWPIVAVALMLDCPIWTEDNDFFGTGIANWTTNRVHLCVEQSDNK